MKLDLTSTELLILYDLLQASSLDLPENHNYDLQCIRQVRSKLRNIVISALSSMSFKNDDHRDRVETLLSREQRKIDELRGELSSTSDNVVNDVDEDFAYPRHSRKNRSGRQK